MGIPCKGDRVMDEYAKTNREHWNELASINVKSDFYDVEGFKKGNLSLLPIERGELGDVTGKSLLHLQCHFGLDTLSWARLGAKVTGVDFSDKSIDLARAIARETGIESEFLCSDVYDLPNVLDKTFDIVFTSYGVLLWMPDINKWASVVSHFLKPGGTFYIVELHPFVNVFDVGKEVTELKVKYPYFHSPTPDKWESDGSYADREANLTHASYEWTHGMSDILNALIASGLKIEFIHEFPYCCYQRFPFMEKHNDGLYHMTGDKEKMIPLMFSLKAIKTL